MTSALLGALTAFFLAAPVAALPESYSKMSAARLVPQPSSYWQPVSAAQAKRLGLPRLRPQRYRVVRLNLPALRQLLATAPPDGAAGPLLRLPLPDGSLATFRMRTSAVMAPALAAKYPELQTYAGVEVGQPANDVRLEITPAGLRAMLVRQGRTFFIEPYRPRDTQHYLCFDKASLPAGSKQGFELPATPTH